MTDSLFSLRQNGLLDSNGLCGITRALVMAKDDRSTKELITTTVDKFKEASRGLSEQDVQILILAVKECDNSQLIFDVITSPLPHADKLALLAPSTTLAQAPATEVQAPASAEEESEEESEEEDSDSEEEDDEDEESSYVESEAEEEVKDRAPSSPNASLSIANLKLEIVPSEKKAQTSDKSKRLQALLNTASNDGATESEKGNANRLARRLIAKGVLPAVSDEAVAGSTRVNFFNSLTGKRFRFNFIFFNTLSQSIADFFDCESFVYASQKQLSQQFVGTSENSHLAATTYVMFLDAINSDLGELSAREEYEKAKTTDSLRKFRGGFVESFGSGFSRTLGKMIQDAISIRKKAREEALASGSGERYLLAQKELAILKVGQASIDEVSAGCRTFSLKRSRSEVDGATERGSSKARCSFGDLTKGRQI